MNDAKLEKLKEIILKGNDGPTTVIPYQNKHYSIYLISTEDKCFAKVTRKTDNFPIIFNNGIMLNNHNMLNDTEIQDHIDMVTFALNTRNQILELAENLIIE